MWILCKIRGTCERSTFGSGPYLSPRGTGRAESQYSRGCCAALRTHAGSQSCSRWPDLWNFTERLSRRFSWVLFVGLRKINSIVETFKFSGAESWRGVGVCLVEPRGVKFPSLSGGSFIWGSSTEVAGTERWVSALGCFFFMTAGIWQGKLQRAGFPTCSHSEL